MCGDVTGQNLNKLLNDRGLSDLYLDRTRIHGQGSPNMDQFKWLSLIFLLILSLSVTFSNGQGAGVHRTLYKLSHQLEQGLTSFFSEDISKFCHISG